MYNIMILIFFGNTFVKFCIQINAHSIFQIKFLKTKEGTAMVQMGDRSSVERCVQNLNNVTVNDHTMTFAYVS